MARIALKAAVAIALLAILLHYVGLTPSILGGLELLFPRLGGSPTRTINAPKLLADLNSDILSADSKATTTTTTPSSWDPSTAGHVVRQGDNSPNERAASAALSVMYLASLPGLREQVKQAPGIVESLVRRVMTLDLAEVQRDLLRQQQEHHQQQQRQQHQRHLGHGHGHGQGQGQRMDFMSAALVALSKLVAGDRQLQDWVLGATEGGSGGGSGGSGGGGGGRRERKLMPQGKLLSRLGEVFKSDVPRWQAAASVLLHSLSTEGGSDSPSQEQKQKQQQQRQQVTRPHPQHHPLVLGWVSERVDVLARVGKTLVEAGAHFNSSDAVQSGAQLLQLVAVLPAGRKVILELEVPVLLSQVILSYAGGNSNTNIKSSTGSSSSGSSSNDTVSSGSSAMVGAAARLLHQLAALTAMVAEGCDDTTAEAAQQQQQQQLVKNLTAMGLVAPLVREVRQGQAASLGPSLELLMELIGLTGQEGRGSGSGGGRGGTGGTGGGGGIGSGTGGPGGPGGPDNGSGNNEGVREAVGAGALSLCVQLLFQASSDNRAHSACCDLVRYTAAHRKLPPAPASGGRSGGSGVLEAVDDVDDVEEEGVDNEDGDGQDSDEAGRDVDGGGALLCERSEAGRRALASELLRVMRGTDFADLHNSVLEACRDVAPSRTAALAFVEAGIIRHLAVVLAHNTTKSREEGSHDASSIAWILQSQRSASALVGLLALQPELRERLVAEGALGGLVTALRVHSGLPGLMAQVRVTAAAALVPTLGDESRYHRLAVAGGVLEPLLEMYARGSGSRGGGGGAGAAAASQEAQVARRVMTLLAGEEPVAEMFKNLGIEL